MCCTMYHAPSTMYHESRCTMDHGPWTMDHGPLNMYYAPCITHPPTHSPTHLQPTTLPLTSPQQPSKPQASNMEPFRVRYSYRTPSIPMDPSGGCPSLQVTKYFRQCYPPALSLKIMFGVDAGIIFLNDTTRLNNHEIGLFHTIGCWIAYCPLLFPCGITAAYWQAACLQSACASCL